MASTDRAMWSPSIPTQQWLSPDSTPFNNRSILKSVLAAPAIIYQNPANAATLSAGTSVSFHATFPNLFLELVVWAEYASGTREMVFHSDVGFCGNYGGGGSSWSYVDNSLEVDLTISCTGGWLAAPTLKAHMFDKAGNLTIATLTYGLA